MAGPFGGLGPRLRPLLLFVVFAGTLPGTATVRSALATASTHLWAPSTDVQPFGVVHVTSDYYLPIEMDVAGYRIPTVTNLGLTVGVIPSKVVQAEVGIDHKSGLGVLDEDPMYGNVKLGVPEGVFGTFAPALAAGIYDVGTKSGATDFNIVYAKVAKTIPAGSTNLGRVSVGWFVGNQDLLLDANGRKDNRGVLLAWERTMSEWTDRLWLCAEYMGTESAYGTSNFGLAWKFAPNVSAIGAVDLFNNPESATTATFQVDLDF
jgi:hypothetical protein